MRARITEHTTTEDAFCVVEEVGGQGRTGEFHGTISEFRHLNPHVEIVEEIWS